MRPLLQESPVLTRQQKEKKERPFLSTLLLVPLALSFSSDLLLQSSLFQMICNTEHVLKRCLLLFCCHYSLLRASYAFRCFMCSQCSWESISSIKQSEYKNIWINHSAVSRFLFSVQSKERYIETFLCAVRQCQSCLQHFIHTSLCYSCIVNFVRRAGNPLDHFSLVKKGKKAPLHLAPNLSCLSPISSTPMSHFLAALVARWARKWDWTGSCKSAFWHSRQDCHIIIVRVQRRCSLVEGGGLSARCLALYAAVQLIHISIWNCIEKGALVLAHAQKLSSGAPQGKFLINFVLSLFLLLSYVGKSLPISKSVKSAVGFSNHGSFDSLTGRNPISFSWARKWN